MPSPRPPRRRQPTSVGASVSRADDRVGARDQQAGAGSSEIRPAVCRGQAEQTDNARHRPCPKAAARDRRRGQADHCIRRTDQPAGAHRGPSRRRARAKPARGFAGGGAGGDRRWRRRRQGDRPRSVPRSPASQTATPRIGRRHQGDRRHRSVSIAEIAGVPTSRGGRRAGVPRRRRSPATSMRPPRAHPAGPVTLPTCTPGSEPAPPQCRARLGQSLSREGNHLKSEMEKFLHTWQRPRRSTHSAMPRTNTRRSAPALRR